MFSKSQEFDGYIDTTVKEESAKCKKCGMDLSKLVTARHRINELVEENGSRLFTSLLDYSYPFNNRHIKNEVKGIVSCLFSIFYLPKKYVEQEVKRNIELIEEIESDPSSRVNSRVDEAEVKRNLNHEKTLYNYVAELNTSA